ncbi:MAG: hypothetical protein QOE76_199 [Frankiales bacterium]|nr:hypothetical protein [Frankiales bacterium]MDX6242476.1 hypothetical protein [Frankiales bacterium]
MGESAIGKLATVVSRVRGAAGPGEVCILVGGTYETFLAYSETVLERGREVLVVSSHSPGSFNVVPSASSADRNPYTDPLPGPDAHGVAGAN